MKKVLATILALVMALSLCTSAWAASPIPEEAKPENWDTLKITRVDGTELTAGTDYTVTDGEYSHYAYSEPFTYHIYNILTSDAIVISGGAQYKNDSLSNPLKSRVKLDKSVTDVTLKDITALGELSVADGSNVVFTLVGDNNIDYIYGVGATTNMTFAGDGSLAGKHIGGVNKYGAAKGTNIGCNITINSGTFNITAGYESAIGGGQYGDSGKITINGGKITAKSNYGAAIGGGQNGDAGEIVIVSGEIDATGSFGAAIGGGQQGNAKDIAISGGNITAKGSHVGAAIGGGQNGDAQKISITDGEITAIARDRAIGGKNVGTISISGGDIRLGKLNSSSQEVAADASQIGAATGGTSTEVKVSGGTFAQDISSLVTGNEAIATTGEADSKEYHVGNSSIAKAAGESGTITVVKGSELSDIPDGTTVINGTNQGENQGNDITINGDKTVAAGETEEIKAPTPSTGGYYYYPSTPGITAELNGSNKSATDYPGGDYGLVFRSTAAFSTFQGVQVDGKTLAKSNYTAEEGSTVVYLKAAYLKTLAAGKHTVTILSTSGNTSMDFTVGGKTTAPQTFDAGVGIYAVTAVLSVTGMAWTAKKRGN